MRVIIKTQEEYDSLDTNFKEFTTIEIRSDEIIKIREAYHNSTVRAYLQSVVRLYSGSLEAYDNVTVYNYRNSEFEKEDSVNVIDNFIESTFDQWVSRGVVYADGIYRELKDTRVQGNITVYTVEDGYVVKRGEVFSHGETVSKAIEDLRFKLSDRDKSEFENWSLDDVKSTDDIIQAYRVITGACEQGVKDFCSKVQLKDEYKLSEIVEMVEGHFGDDDFREFLK